MTHRWHHASLTVEAIDPACAFFAAAFGFEPVFIARSLGDDLARMTGRPGMDCEIAQMRRPGAESMLLELIAFRIPDGKPPAGDEIPWRPGAGHVAFVVEQLDRELDRLTGLGARRLGDIVSYPGGRAVYCGVPGGAFIELEEHAPEGM